MERNNSELLVHIVLRQTNLEEISHYIYAFVFPVVFLFGIIGNVLSSLTFTITKLKKTSCGFYFLVLAIADTTALIGGLHHCLTIGYHVPVPNATYCRVRNFFLYTSMDITSWMIVAISVDRYLKVKYPISARVYATRRLSIIVSCIIIVIFILKNFHLATIFIGDFTEDAADNCDPNPNYPAYVKFYKNIWPWLDLITYALLPFVIVAISNGLIIRDQYKRRYKYRKRDLDISLISLLLVSSISFIVCNIPITILAAIYPYISSSFDSKANYDAVAFIFDLFRIPSYGAFGFNFYLYYYNSAIFRQQAMQLFKRVCMNQNRMNEFELPHIIYNNQNPFDHRMHSIEELDEDTKSSGVVLNNRNSFISNFYRQNS